MTPLSASQNANGNRFQHASSLAPIKTSFEFFPPKNNKMEARFWKSLDILSSLGPRFISVTYGAGGTTRENTLRMVSDIYARTGISAAGHLTCVDAPKADVDQVIKGYCDAGVKSIVALRGDPKGGVGTQFEAHPEGYRNAAELVAGIRAIGDFDISVAAYPEKHPESPSWDAEIDNLKRKIDAGASRAITQFFYNNDDYERLLERVRAAGITVPIVAGIQPVHDFTQISNFAARCGASIPDWLAERFAGLENDPETHGLVASALVAEQVQDLRERGVSEFHFYTMNRASLVFALAKILGLPKAA